MDEVGLAGSKVFSTIDLTSGFWQQSLEEGSRQYTAFMDTQERYSISMDSYSDGSTGLSG